MKESRQYPPRPSAGSTKIMIRATKEEIHCKNCGSEYLEAIEEPPVIFARCLDCNFRFIIGVTEEEGIDE